MVKKSLLLIVFVFPLLLHAQDKWDLRRCIDYAINNNISIKQTDVQARIAALQLKQAQLNQYPNASLSANAGWQFGRSIDPTTNQFTTTQLFYQNWQAQGGATIFNFGRLNHITKSTAFNLKAAEAEVERVANSVALNVANFYLQVLAAQEQIKIVGVQIAQTQTQLNITRIKVNAGSLPELNLLEVEAQLATDSSNYISAQSTYEQALISLKALLNIDMANPFEITTPPVETIPLEPLADLEPEYVYSLARINQPLTREDSFKVESAKRNILANRAALFPTLSGFYSLGTTFNNQSMGVIGSQVIDNIPIGKVNINGTSYQVFPNEPFVQNIYGKTGYFKQLNNNFSQGVGIGLSIPIFNNGSGRISLENSKMNLRSAELQKEQNDQNLKSDIYNAYTTAIASMERYFASGKSVASSQQAYDFAQKRYEVGLLSTMDLLTYQNKLLTAKLQQLANHFDYVFKMKVLEFYKTNTIKL